MATDLYRGLIWRGGAFNIGVLLTWGLMTSGRTLQTLQEIDWVDAFRRLPLEDAAADAAQDLPFWRDWLEHPTRDPYWDGVDAEARLGAVTAPAIVMGGWYDLYADDASRQFELLRTLGATPEARASRLVMGPWPHSLSASTLAGGVDFGNRALFDLDLLEERWFDRWLRDVRNGVDEEPAAKLFVMGAGEWRDASAWPLQQTEWQTWYLHSGGSAATLRGDGTLSQAAPGDEPADTFVYDPEFPVPTNGGPNCCSPEIVPWGAYDQRGIEMRSDVLVYTSEPLARDLEVIGPVRVVLFAATDGPDTDWTAKLVDVRPGGFAMNLCDGILRGRFRDGFDEERLAEPGEVLRYEIDLMATANLFRAGHRIRLEVSSSNFPRFDRNPNTGGPIGREHRVRQARQTVVHAGTRASHVVLPVIPASGR
jgi:putative CocE/NonD family hydrolase